MIRQSKNISLIFNSSATKTPRPVCVQTRTGRHQDYNNIILLKIIIWEFRDLGIEELKDVVTFNSSIPQFAISQFINHIPHLCLCALVAELLPLFLYRIPN